MAKYFLEILIVLGIIISGGYLVLVYGRRPAKHKIHASGDFNRFLSALLYRGYDKGFMI